MKILFICSGNTCRSAMAEGIAKQWASERNLDWEIASAGTLGLEGQSASTNAILVCEEIDVNINDHINRGLTAEMLREFDIVFGMEYAHLQYAKWLAPDESWKIYLLGGYGPKAKDIEIPDPIGRDIDFFREVRDMIRKEIERVFTSIL